MFSGSSLTDLLMSSHWHGKGFILQLMLSSPLCLDFSFSVILFYQVTLFTQTEDKDFSPPTPSTWGGGGEKASPSIWVSAQGRQLLHLWFQLHLQSQSSSRYLVWCRKRYRAGETMWRRPCSGKSYSVALAPDLSQAQVQAHHCLARGRASIYSMSQAGAQDRTTT